MIVVTERYEHGGLVCEFTRKVFDDWGQAFCHARWIGENCGGNLHARVENVPLGVIHRWRWNGVKGGHFTLVV